MKKVQLIERADNGRIQKNESYDMAELASLVQRMNPGFFGSWLYGRIRRVALRRVFDTFNRLIDKDAPGVSRVVERDM